MPRTKQNIQDNQTTNVLTQEQKAIIERVSNQSTEWFTIGEESMNDFSLMINPMNLEPNYQKAADLQNEKKYVFRWCERTPSRIDELTRSVNPPLRWAIVNRNTLPELADKVDDVLGGVCCLDQILLFKPYNHAMMVNKAKQEMAEAKAKSPQERIQIDKVDVTTGEKFKIDGRTDQVEYEDGRIEEGFGDLVVDE